ncbi:MAG: helix-turn-helix transcriptional regulator [Eggerthellaceae bacterium]|nr:helix-turn-helix transcriptional regulator [Eggerthellaceae bacterium]
MKSRLNVVMAEKGLRKVDVAKAIGVHMQSMWRWSTDEGIEGISLRTLSKLAEAIGCDAKDLFEE